MNQMSDLTRLSPLFLGAFLAACGEPVSERQAGAAHALPASAEAIRPVLTGTPAPSFTAARVDGSAFQFEPGKLERPAILLFYRGGWCPYCNAHLGELRTVEAELRGLGYDLLFLSADSPATLRAGDPDPAAAYTLVADNDLDAARAFGIAFRLDDATVARYLEYGIDLEAASGRDHHGLPVPAVFIVRTDGVIAFQYVNPAYTERVAPELLLAAARAALDDRDVRTRTEQATVQD